MSIIDICVSNCIEWNAARYDRVYNKELRRALLMEELGELDEAQTEVEKMDAVGDILFVAIGTMWSLGLAPHSISSILNIALGRYYNYSSITWVLIKDRIDTLSYGIDSAEHKELKTFVFLLCGTVIPYIVAELSKLYLANKIWDILLVICESNNTKDAVKTDPGIKANIVKGANYKPPTEGLEQILKERNNYERY